jgi:HSP20 family protein
VKWISHERPYGSYMRQFTLGDGVDLDRISANYEHGVLSVIVPVAERAKPRKIQIAAQGGSMNAGSMDAGEMQAADRREVTA